MRSICLCFVIAISFNAALGQVKRPPAAKTPATKATRFSKPAPASLVAHKGLNDSYSAVFAGKPTRSRIVQNGTLIVVDRSQPTAAFEESVTTLFLPSAMDPAFGFETFRHSFVNRLGGEIVTETEVVVDGVKGIRFDARLGDSRRISTVVPDKKRIFEFTFVVHDWASSKVEPELVRLVDEEAARFFGSVGIAPEPPDEIPLGILGEWRENLYVNEVLGFAWAVSPRLGSVDTNAIETAQKNMSTVFQTNDQLSRRKLEDSLRNEIVLGALSAKDDPNQFLSIVLSVRKVGPYISLWELADSSIAAFSNLDNVTIVGSLKSASMGGEQYIHWSLRTDREGVTIHQHIIVFLRKGYATVFVVSSFDEAESLKLIKAIETIRWNRPAAAKKPAK